MPNESSIDDAISKVVTLFRSAPDLEDEGAYRALIAVGIEGQLAARLVEFLPIAYCRVILAHSGVRFSQSFRRTALGGAPQEQLFSSDPVWTASLEFARAEVRRGVIGKDLLLVAARSAEFHAANQLLKSGSELENLTFTSPILLWPDRGPDSGHNG